MTIVVALSQVIPLSDFNVALGYDLSRPEQVLATHPRSRWPARTNRRTRTYTHTPIIPPQHRATSLHQLDNQDDGLLT